MTPAGDEPRKPSRLKTLLRWLIDPGESLRNRTLNAGVWSAVLSVSTRLLRLVRTIVLARLLAPTDFGLMGIAMLAIALLQTFTKTGLNRALIQRDGEIDGHLDTAWTVAVIRGLILGLVLLIGAPLVGRFFNSPEAVPLLRALALIPLVQGLTNVGVVFFDKDLLFRQRFLYRSVPRIVELTVSIGLAIWLRNAWALVLGLIAAHLATTVASYVAHSYRPRLQIDTRKLRELLGFGLWVTANGILIFLMLSIDDIVVGRLLTPEDLGLYQMAFTITTLIAIEITYVVNQVTFPAFSKLQSKPKVLRRAYLETLQLVTFAAMPVAAGLWFVGPTAVEYLLGEKWLGLLPAFGPLVIWGLVRSIGGTAGPLFSSIGKPWKNTAVYGAATVVLAILINPFTSTWNIEGAAWATVAAATAFIIHIALAGRELKTGWWNVLRPIAIPVACSAIMLLALLAVANVVPDEGGPWLLLWGPLVGVAVYTSAVLIAHRFLQYRPLRFLNRIGDNPA